MFDEDSRAQSVKSLFQECKVTHNSYRNKMKERQKNPKRSLQTTNSARTRICGCCRLNVKLGCMAAKK